jgi:hypothetical protein
MKPGIGKPGIRDGLELNIVSMNRPTPDYGCLVHFDANTIALDQRDAGLADLVIAAPVASVREVGWSFVGRLEIFPIAFIEWRHARVAQCPI